MTHVMDERGAIWWYSYNLKMKWSLALEGKIILMNELLIYLMRVYIVLSSNRIARKIGWKYRHSSIIQLKVCLSWRIDIGLSWSDHLKINGKKIKMNFISGTNVIQCLCETLDGKRMKSVDQSKGCFKVLGLKKENCDVAPKNLARVKNLSWWST